MGNNSLELGVFLESLETKGENGVVESAREGVSTLEEIEKYRKAAPSEGGEGSEYDTLIQECMNWNMDANGILNEIKAQKYIDSLSEGELLNRVIHYLEDECMPSFALRKAKKEIEKK